MNRVIIRVPVSDVVKAWRASPELTYNTPYGELVIVGYARGYLTYRDETGEGKIHTSQHLSVYD